MGDGTYTQRNAPITVDSGVSYKKINLGGSENGGYTTCGITSADDLKCWGYGAALGTGDTNDRLTPTVIDPGTSYSWISAGEVGACGVTTAGVLKCWGKNNFGQVGSPDVLVSSTANQKTPLVIDPGTLYSKVSMQKAWAGGSSIIHTCGITVGGSLNCWGDNSYG